MERVGLVERKGEQIRQVCDLKNRNVCDFTPLTIQSPLFSAGHIVKCLWGWVSHLFVNRVARINK